MTEAAKGALADAWLSRRDIDGVVTGYSSTFPHLMLAKVVVRTFRPYTFLCPCRAGGRRDWFRDDYAGA
ncbi:MAG: hypothetical protein JOY71_26415 [Acetobacteraceae bacterium]|nr:hypothetical protein [Acetobacteraceae bacterium]MBV8591401.1 hypothetical protein [Acetobacteraceae bacterium]